MSEGENPQAENGSSIHGEVVEDLLLTDAFLIKGSIQGKFRRLSAYLEEEFVSFLALSSASMVDLRNGEVIRTPRVHVNLDEVILAHELLDSSSDYYQRLLNKESGTIPIRAFHHGVANLELAGRIRPGAYYGGPEQRFFIMESCRIRGLNPSISNDFNMLSELSYAIINRSKLAYIYDFS
ncbi:MAG: hypothetical protein ACE5F1_04510 [Planctomycetota bacterium]